MASSNLGWYVAFGGSVLWAFWNSRRPGEMNETRDRAYVECLSGRVPVEKMRELANAFEKARCYPQARMLRLRINLEELPAEKKDERRAIFQRAMESKNHAAVLRVAQAFEQEGATTSASRLRAHAERLAKALTEAPPIVTPPPAEPPAASVPASDVRQEAAPVNTSINGVSNIGAAHVAVSETTLTN